MGDGVSRDSYRHEVCANFIPHGCENQVAEVGDICAACQAKATEKTVDILEALKRALAVARKAREGQ